MEQQDEHYLHLVIGQDNNYLYPINRAVWVQLFLVLKKLHNRVFTRLVLAS